MGNNVKNVIAVMVAAVIAMNDLQGNLWDMQSVAEAASVKKMEQSIEGPFAYNLVWDSTDGSGILKCSAMTKINYSVLEGSDYTTIDGARITMSQRGNAVILATAAESAIYKSTTAIIVKKVNLCPIFTQPRTKNGTFNTKYIKDVEIVKGKKRSLIEFIN